MKLRHRSFLLLLSLSLLTSLALVLGARTLLREAERQQMKERIRAELGLLALSLSTEQPPEELQSLALEARRLLGFRVTVVDAEGVVLADSSLDRSGVARMDNHRDRPEVRGAVANGVGESVRLSSTTGVEFFYAARRLPTGGAVVRLALPSSQLDRLRGQPLWILWGAGLAALLLHTALAYRALRRISVPVEHIARRLGQFGPGQVPDEVAYEEGNEIGELGAALNRLSHSLGGRIRALEERQELLSAAVSGMQEGLLLVGPDRRVLLASQAFRTIFRLDGDPAGQPLASLLRHPTVLRDVDAALERGEGVHGGTFEALEAGRSFALHVTPLEVRGGGSKSGRCALVVLFDVTRLEALERVRRDFVANVSHELRTPLTSITAFVETLLEEGLRDREHGLEFLQIVRKHAGRMEELVDDLTDLSRIETGAVQLEIGPVVLRAAAEEALEQVRHRHQGSAVTLHNDVAPGLEVEADARRLGEILLNLADNAVKFNRPDGSVRITASAQPQKVLLAVEDTGAGIPSDSLEKVFQRFYRVDKARSRDVGGTGLGLSIVKHLVRLHGGTVHAESELGRGTRFVVELPRPRH